MALRLPGASSVDELWRRLQAGDDLLEPLPIPAHATSGAKGGGKGGVARKGLVRDEGVDLALCGLRPAHATLTLNPSQP